VRISVLVNHLWSIAETGLVKNQLSFIQPFFFEKIPASFTAQVNSTSHYDWNGDQWAVPLNLAASQPVNLGAGLILPRRRFGSIRSGASGSI